jgi:hypothetical protein
VSGGQPSVWRRTATKVEELDSERVGLALLIVAMAAAVALLLWIERGALFSTDEWSWLDLSGTEAIDEVLRPLNGHLMALPLLIYKAILHLWGLEPLAFKLIEMVAVVACSALLYVYSRRRIGPIMALAPAAMPLFFGTGAAIILQPLVGIQLIYAAAFGLGALVAVEREERYWDVVACIALFLSMCCFSFGVTFLAGIAVSIMLGEGRRRRAYVFLVPAVLYAAWRIWAGIKFGLTGGPELHNVPALPFYYVDSFAATVTGLFGLAGIVGAGPGTALFLQGISLQNTAITVVFATFEVVIVVYAIRRLLAKGSIPKTFWTALAILFTLWTLQGLVLNDGRTPGETRYLYAGSIAFLLVVVEAARGARLSRIGVILVLAVAGAGIVGNLPRFKEGRDGIVLHSTRARAYTAVMDLAGANADPDFTPAVDAPEVATAGVLYFSVSQYFQLESRYGTFAYSVSELMAQSEEVRNGADTIAVDILGLGLQSAPRMPARGCAAFNTGGEGGFVDLPRGGAIVRASTDTPAALRRFADETVVPVGELEAGRPAVLEIPPDRAAIPWKLDTEGPLTLTACRLG